METPIEVRIECARGEILNAVERISREQGLPVMVVDGVISSVLSEIRAQGEMELINAYLSLKNDSEVKISELNEELEKAKKAAKAVLKAEETADQEQDQEGDAGDGGGNETDN